jgi:tetratricopeptide (TPR) repeat protein
MSPTLRILIVAASILTFAYTGKGQADEFCQEAGFTPSLDSPFAHVPYVFGRVVVKGSEPNSKLPRVVVSYRDAQQPAARLILNRSGNYCFRRTGSSGQLVVEVDGTEVARRTLPSIGEAQVREDFEIDTKAAQASGPAVISPAFQRPPNDKTAPLYKLASDAERDKDWPAAIEHVKRIVAVDPEDFVAWARLGLLYLQQKSYNEADQAFRRSLELKVDYTPAWVSVGQLRVAQKQYEAAIQIYSHAVELDRTNARTFRLLGEAYLLAKQGSLGVRALDEALRLDPVGMAEAHLEKAHLYELAGAKNLATREYKIFLTKVPDHPDRKRLEKFIKENPE